MTRLATILAAAAALAAALLAVATVPAAERTRLTLMLDWYPNPNHAPIFAAAERGDFAALGLDLVIQAPADPSDPLKLAAAGKVDVAIAYQPMTTTARSEGLPVAAFGVLVGEPLGSVMTIERSGIRTVAELKGKRVGFSVPGFEEALLGAVLASAGLGLGDVTLTNVHFNLTPALLGGQVAAVVGAYKNYEKIALELEGERVRVFDLVEHGVPPYDELVFVANDATLEARAPALRAFMAGVAKGMARVRETPDDALAALHARHPESRTELTRRAFAATRPLFATRLAPDPSRWARFQAFLLERKVIARTSPVARLVRTDLAPR